MIKNKIIAVLLLVFINATCLPSIASADEVVDSASIDGSIVRSDLEYPAPIVMADGFTYWENTYDFYSYGYGSWRNGPSGRGPSSLSVSHADSTTYNFNFTNSISGKFFNIGKIASALDIEIGVEKTYGTNYSVSVPSGKKYQLIFRPHYRVIKVTQTQFLRMDGYTTKTGAVNVSYVKIFENWDFDWKIIK